jgi:trans-2,3-dihydro-3-hydroxyanthranilate isomerase
MMPRAFYIVDVFAERPYAGNPLAVVATEDALPDETMQQIARETNFSETTFVNRAPDAAGRYRVRMFTPAREVLFAGHPILGTAWIVRHRLGAASPDLVPLSLAVGEVPVAFEQDIAWFVAPEVHLGPTCPPASIASALGLVESDIDTRAPVQVASAGTAALIVPLRSLDALRRSRLDLDRFVPLAADGFPRLVYLFCEEARQSGNQFSARFFFEANGVREDPATGNGAAFLGAWLLEYRWLGTDLSIRIEQGHEMGRPSVVLLQARSTPARRIRVGGRVIPIVEGELL